MSAPYICPGIPLHQQADAEKQYGMSALPGALPLQPLRLSTFLRDQRRDRGWSQSHLAKLAGLEPTHNQVGHIEQEAAYTLNAGNALRDMLIRLGNALGCRSELLLLAGFAPESTVFDKLKPELAQALREAILAGVDQGEIAAQIRGAR